MCRDAAEKPWRGGRLSRGRCRRVGMGIVCLCAFDTNDVMVYNGEGGQGNVEHWVVAERIHSM